MRFLSANLYSGRIIARRGVKCMLLMIAYDSLIYVYISLGIVFFCVGGGVVSGGLCVIEN